MYYRLWLGSGIRPPRTIPLGPINLDKLDLNQVVTLNRSCVPIGTIKDFHLGQPLKTIYGIGDQTQITSFSVDEKNPYFTTDKRGVLFSSNKDTLVYYCTANSAIEYTIPKEVKNIGSSAFHAARNLTSVTIPGNVSSIGDQAFRACSELETVTFKEPSSLKSLQQRCFDGDSKITSLTLPSSLENLTYWSLRGMSGLKEIIVPNGSQLTTLPGACLENTNNLEAFTFQGSTKLTTIGPGVFQNKTKLNNFDIPASVTTIAANAFQGCSGLTDLSFAENSQIQTIKAGAFSDCGVKSIDIPESVKTIEREAFRNCKVLAKVNLSKNTTSVSPEAFKYCTNLTDFTVDDANPTYSAVLGMLCNKDKSTLVIFPAGQANKELVLLPPSLTAIGDYAFYDCQNLTNVVIPQKVERIGKRAFGLDAKLTSIAFLCDKMIDPANINQKLNEWSFDDGSDAAPLNMFGNINIYVRKELVDEYRNSTFYKKFKGIKTSFSVKHEDNVNEELVDEYMPLSDNAMELLSTKAQVNTFVLGSVTSPEDNITRNVYMIGDYAFEGSDVKEVVCRNNIEAIGAMAFVTKTTKTTSGTTTTVKPESTTIEKIFFCGKTPASQLSSQIFELTDDFNEFYGNQKIYVRKSCFDTYKKAWTTFADRIDYKIPDAKVSNKYGTFAREFDVDFNDYYENATDGARVVAFTAGAWGKGTGDYGDETTYHVRMVSVPNGDGFYVPANTGVLLKVTNENKIATPEDFYYCIGEQDGETSLQGNNVMVGVTVRNKSVSGNDVWVMQGGQFHPLNDKTIQNFSVHKAYLKLEKAVAGAKVMFDFEDGSTTSIDEINKAADANEGVYYNLLGVRVEKPGKGIYIKNGKKVIFK